MYSPGENSFQLVSWRHIVLISRSTVAYSTSPSDLAREIRGNSWDSCIGKPAKSGGLKVEAASVDLGFVCRIPYFLGPDDQITNF
jgi:hypothetical protein